jgi:hypothetical protein
LANPQGDCDIPDADDLSSTQASAGVMTPFEGWSDVGSDLTEKICEEPTPITYNDLHEAAKCTGQFAKFLELLMKGEIGGVEEGACAETTELIHRRYSILRWELNQFLRVTQRGPLVEHVSPARGRPLPSQSSDQAANPQSAGDYHEDRALEEIFSEIGSEVTNEDVARFARHWMR